MCNFFSSLRCRETSTGRSLSSSHGRWSGLAKALVLTRAFTVRTFAVTATVASWLEKLLLWVGRSLTCSVNLVHKCWKTVSCGWTTPTQWCFWWLCSHSMESICCKSYFWFFMFLHYSPIPFVIQSSQGSLLCVQGWSESAEVHAWVLSLLPLFTVLRFHMFCNQLLLVFHETNLWIGISRTKNLTNINIYCIYIWYKCSFISCDESRFCDTCLASVSKTTHPAMHGRNYSLSAAWRRTRLDHQAYLQRDADSLSPYLEIPGFSYESVVYDWLHNIYLGCGRDLFASGLKMLVTKGVWDNLAADDWDSILAGVHLEMHKVCADAGFLVPFN